MARRCVIVGAGVAGLAAAETRRQLDSEATITGVGDEVPYSRRPHGPCHSSLPFEPLVYPL